MGNRRHGEGFRGRSPSPRRPMPRSRGFNGARHRRFSPYRLEREEYCRDFERSRTTERRGHYDRDCGPRFSDYDNRDRYRYRDRDRYVEDAHRSRSPPRIEKRDNFHRETARVPYNDVGVGDDYRNNVSVGSSRLPYHKDSSHADLSSVKSQSDRLLDGPRKSPLNVGDYGGVPGGYGVGNNNLVRGGNERHDYWRNQYPDSSRSGLLQSSQYLDNDTSLYDGGGRMPSHSYMTVRGSVDDMPRNNLSGGDGRNEISSVALRYMNSGTTRSEFSRFPGELELDEKDGVYGDRENIYFDKKSDGLRFLDNPLGREKTEGREIENFKKEGTLLSSQGYFKADSDYLASSSQHKDDVVELSSRYGDYVPEPSSRPKDYVHDSSNRPKDYDRESSYRPRDYFPEPSSRSKDYVPEQSSQPKDYILEPFSRSKEYVPEPSSRPMDYAPASSGNLREGFQGYTAVAEIRMPSYDIQSGNKLTPKSLRGYSEEKSNMSPRGPCLQRSYLGLTEGVPGDELHREFGKGNIEEQDRENYIRRIDESSHSKSTRHDELWDPYQFSWSGSTPCKFNDYGAQLTSKQDPDMLGAGSSCFSYGTEGFCQNSSILPYEHHADISGALQSNGERLDILQARSYDPSYGGVYGSPRKRFTLDDLSFTETSNRRLVKKQVSEEVMYERRLGITISTDGNGSRRIYNQAVERDEFGSVKISKPESSKSTYQETWMESREMATIWPSSSKSAPSNSAKPDSRDVKKRLGPVSHKLHVSHRLTKKHNPSIKKRLRPAHTRKNATPPWLKNGRSNWASATDDSDGIPHDQEGDHLGDRDSLTKSEPPEKSEDFKQMVQSAFFKFLKELYETSMKRKKYKEQGKAGSLKCIVCGRSVFYILICFIDGATRLLNFP